MTPVDMPSWFPPDKVGDVLKRLRGLTSHELVQVIQREEARDEQPRSPSAQSDALSTDTGESGMHIMDVGLVPLGRNQPVDAPTHPCEPTSPSYSSGSTSGSDDTS